ncbi:alkaline phosphatase D [Limnobacter thiooxidans]|uniref:Alkaline phosphatase n=1 Tax=Limnobacter thiooxidans TaxID=131080 RepID=A0AA86MF22_9BURK|nr:alkaline phosphatase D [Limnobacter thiooxidans]BET26665.1 alkaline phosphatase [Limnobacter thiooxidans]
MDRRHFLRTGLAGISLPALVACGSDDTGALQSSTGSGPTVRPAEEVDALIAQNAFAWGVASGDPTAHELILWTAIAPANENVVSVPLILEYVLVQGQAEDPAQWNQIFQQGPIQQLGEFLALKARDYTVKIDLGNSALYENTSFGLGQMPALVAGQTVLYRFRAGSQTSRIGRSKTLPEGEVEQIRFATVSCSNLPAGFFSVYEMVRKESLDFVIHLGDYLYEGGGGGGNLNRNGVSRQPRPAKEMVLVEDYVQRHKQYKADPELQALHATHPMIAVWDDHEITNDAYKDGADNHQPDEGDYLVRRAIAIRTYYNWMPLRERFSRLETTFEPDPREVIYRDFQVGDLCSLIMLDTRIIGRDKQVEIVAVDPDRFNPQRNLLGLDQRRWLSDRLFASKQKNSLWTVLGQQVMFGQLNLLELPQVKLLDQSVLGNIAAVNMDQWDGYVAERNRVFNMIKDIGIENLVVLTGDIHTSWAIELFENPFTLLGGNPLQRSLGVEVVTPSVTSSGFPDEVADVVSAALPLLNPHIKYNELKTKGFALLEMSRTRLSVTWKYAQSVADESLIGMENEAMRKTMTVPLGSNRFESALPF